MAEETGDGADEARMERIVERVLERQLPSIVVRLAASGTATAMTETSRSLSSEGGSKFSTFTIYTVSPFGDDELRSSTHILLPCGGGGEHYLVIGPVCFGEVC